MLEPVGVVVVVAVLTFNGGVALSIVCLFGVGVEVGEVDVVG